MQEINTKIFRAYDIRGIYPLEINEKTAHNIGRAFADFLKPKKIVVARDIRLSSPNLINNLIQGLIKQGIDVVDVGLASSPMLYFAVSKYGFDGGIIVTASHNSREFNGFKLVDKHSVPFSKDYGLEEIKNIILKNNFLDISKKGKIDNKNILDDYINNIFKFVKAEEIKNLKIVIDAGNGMAGLVLPELFRQLSCQVVPLYWDLDGSFPNHLPEPSKENLKDLKNKVVEEKADLGIAFDGDADRIVFINEKGEIIQADYIIALMAEIFLSKNLGAKVICDLRVSWIVRDIIKQNNGEMILSRVGHSYIKKKMSEEKAVFAGELSGHYYLGKNDNFESVFIVMLLLLKLITINNKKISDIIKPLKKYHNSGELDFEVDDRNKILNKVEFFYENNQNKTSRLDGLSMEFDDWWFNLRHSNTEPVVRLVVEAKEKKLLENKKQELMSIIKGRLIE